MFKNEIFNFLRLKIIFIKIAAKKLRPVNLQFE